MNENSLKIKVIDVNTTRVEVKTTVGDGSDDERVLNITFTDKSLGSGVSGDVLEADIAETGENVAVKTVEISSRRQTIEEVKYLKRLQHCNVVKLLYHFRIYQPDCKVECIVMERMDMSLRQLYKAPGKLTRLELKLYMYQILRSVAYLHNQGICHRDIKPHNVLVNLETCAVKLCDFGFACELRKEDNHETWCGTYPYMAPELLLEFTNYTTSVDIWGVGCILVELLKGKVELFQHQENTTLQLAKMMEVFGTPKEEQFPGMKPDYRFDLLRSMKAKDWSEIISPYPKSNSIISLCSGLLCYAPGSRLLAHHALAHKFFEELRSQKTTCLANGKPLPPLFNFKYGELPDDFEDCLSQPNRGSVRKKSNVLVPPKHDGCCAIM